MKFGMCATAITAALVFVGLMSAGAAPNATMSPVIYKAGLQNGWQSWGWATINMSCPKPVHADTKSIELTDTKGWQALYLHHDDFNTAGYSSVSFWVYGGAKGGQQLKVLGLVGNKANKAYVVPALKAGVWIHVVAPLSAMSIANVKNADGIWIQNGTGKPFSNVFIDDITLVK
jgi:hypothetical protein